MSALRSMVLGVLVGLALATFAPTSVHAEGGQGAVGTVDVKPATRVAPKDGSARQVAARVDHDAAAAHASAGSSQPVVRSIFGDFWHNFPHTLFKPLLLFFYLGFLFPILKVKFDFPYVIYQGL